MLLVIQPLKSITKKKKERSKCLIQFANFMNSNSLDYSYFQCSHNAFYIKLKFASITIIFSSRTTKISQST
uniref:Putative ovule protein n=1 Tax=Solanum chacoense TaxID=4108 RepID=A0A0V0HRR2_SOLCH